MFKGLSLPCYANNWKRFVRNAGSRGGRGDDLQGGRMQVKKDLRAITPRRSQVVVHLTSRDLPCNIRITRRCPSHPSVRQVCHPQDGRCPLHRRQYFCPEAVIPSQSFSSVPAYVPYTHTSLSSAMIFLSEYRQSGTDANQAEKNSLNPIVPCFTRGLCWM